METNLGSLLPPINLNIIILMAVIIKFNEIFEHDGPLGQSIIPNKGNHYHTINFWRQY